jgi:hypothetical protein
VRGRSPITAFTPQGRGYFWLAAGSTPHALGFHLSLPSINDTQRGDFTEFRISCAFVGILVSSCAQNPHRAVPEPAYESASGTPHRPAKRHHVALAQVPLHHPPRRAASEGHRRLLHPWNHLPAAPETPAPANAPTPPNTDHLPNASTPPKHRCRSVKNSMRDRTIYRRARAPAATAKRPSTSSGGLPSGRSEK